MRMLAYSLYALDIGSIFALSARYMLYNIFFAIAYIIKKQYLCTSLSIVIITIFNVYNYDKQTDKKCQYRK